MNTKSMYVFSCMTVTFLSRSPWSRMAANCCSDSASSNIAMGLASRPTTPEARDLTTADASTAMASAQIIAAIKTTQSNRSIWPTLRFGLIPQDWLRTRSAILAEALFFVHLILPRFCKINQALQCLKHQATKIFGPWFVMRRFLATANILMSECILGQRVRPRITQIVQVFLQGTHCNSVSRKDVL